jgi:N-acetylneuraminate synthase
MATLSEIEELLGVIAFGLIYTKGSKDPSRSVFQQAYLSSAGQQLLQERVTLLHCTTEYPAPLQDINLNAMNSMHNAFGLSVGYSDHSKGIAVPIAATAMGANIIEKHFTLDKNLQGPDHSASLEPHELIAMVKAIRSVEQSMGSGLKRPMPSELKNIPIARRSLVAAKNIKQGEVFTEKNLTIKRPGFGVTPMMYWSYIGSTAKRSYYFDDLID